MIHEILERIYTLILLDKEFNQIELNLNQYKELKKDLEETDELTSFIGLQLIIKETSLIHVR